jgi:thiamine-monophosphate kinase
MGEFDYIAWLRHRTAPAPGVRVGPGDDCAVLDTSANQGWLVTTDMLLEGSHFVLAEAGARRVGRKAIAVNLSDIAAMGGKPIAAFVSVGLPRFLPSPGTPGEGLGVRAARPVAECTSLTPGPSPGVPGEGRKIAEELYLGMRDVADAFGTAIAGGDTNTWTGGLVVSVTVMGEPGPQGPILRRGAKPGDWLFVTGPLGGSILGKHLDFTPRVREGLLLQQHATLHAMIDISDGLSADVFQICAESRCGAFLFAERIPISAAARQLSDGKTPLEHALGDGEDFELAFAVDPADGERLLKTQPIPGITLAHVGIFVAETSLFLEDAGTRRRIEPRGFVHQFE